MFVPQFPFPHADHSYGHRKLASAPRLVEKLHNATRLHRPGWIQRIIHGPGKTRRLAYRIEAGREHMAAYDQYHAGNNKE